MDVGPCSMSWKNGLAALKSFVSYERSALARDTRPHTNSAIQSARAAKTTAAARLNHVRRIRGGLRGSIFGFGAPGAAPPFARGLLFVATRSPLKAVPDNQDRNLVQDIQRDGHHYLADGILGGGGHSGDDEGGEDRRP